MQWKSNEGHLVSPESFEQRCSEIKDRMVHWVSQMIGEFQTKISSPRPSLGEGFPLGKNLQKKFMKPNIKEKVKDEVRLLSIDCIEETKSEENYCIVDLAPKPNVQMSKLKVRSLSKNRNNENSLNNFLETEKQIKLLDSKAGSKEPNRTLSGAGTIFRSETLKGFPPLELDNLDEVCIYKTENYEPNSALRKEKYFSPRCVYKKIMEQGPGTGKQSLASSIKSINSISQNRRNSSSNNFYSNW